jgi:hypothetical protein
MCESTNGNSVDWVDMYEPRPENLRVYPIDKVETRLLIG